MSVLLGALIGSAWGHHEISTPVAAVLVVFCALIAALYNSVNK